MPLTDGQHLHDRYWVANLVEQGGFGAVYKAWDITLNRPVALKESYEESVEGQRQFLREAQILASLTHPNLPRVTDFFTIPEQGQYLVMDFVEGKSLEELRVLAGERLPEAQALGYIVQVLDALSYIHRQDPPVIHRDIKPANIKIAPPDENYTQGHAMLVDFGVAKTYDVLKRTTMGARAVTPGYSPIEQYGMGVTDARTDIYALGATLYTLLTGQEPPEAPRRVLRDPLALPRELNPDLSPEIEAVILKAMRLDPDERFQTAGEFKAAVRGLLGVESSRQMVTGSQPPAVSSRTPVVMIQPTTDQVVEKNQIPSPQAVVQPAAAASSTGQAQGHAGHASPTGTKAPAGRGARGGSPPASPPAGKPVLPVARQFPWKIWVLGAGLLAGLVLVVGLGAIAVRNYILAEQSVYWHATWTAMASIPELTQGSPAQASQATEALAALPSEAPVALPPTLVPTSSPVSPTITPSPLPAMPKNTPSGPFEYTVQAGDSLAAIAAMFDSDIVTLLALNPAIDPVAQILNVGQVLLIPAPGSTISSQISPVDGMVQVYIPGGTFQMGEDADRALEQCQLLYEPFNDNTCDRDWFIDEEPVHTVTLDAFWMDQTEVTNGMYAQCVAAGLCNPPYDTSTYSRGSYFDDAAYTDFPVIYVDWSQADAYCAWVGRELPTEAQWEYAARGALAGALYPWGNTFGGILANFCDANCSFDWSNPDFNDGYADTAPVSSYPTNRYGLYDMAGNVWEWVADWYGPYSSGDVDNPSGPVDGNMRVLRGGAWHYSGSELRVADRLGREPGNWSYGLGFRCASSP